MIGRINSAAQIGRLNRVVRRKEAEGGWWLAGGIDPSDCVAAYQAKGAASYAASLVNLANPGTDDAYNGAQPGWNKADGWIFNGINQYIVTDIVPNQNMSAIVRFSNCSINVFDNDLFGSYLAGPLANRLRCASSISSSSGYIRAYMWGSQNQNNQTTPQVTEGVMAITPGVYGYYNGLQDVYYPANWDTSRTPPSMIIGGTRHQYNDAADIYLDGYIQAIAIYPITLSAAQVMALTVKILAL